MEMAMFLDPISVAIPTIDHLTVYFSECSGPLLNPRPQGVFQARVLMEQMILFFIDME